ncbi:MAG: hypothetical protein KIT58_00615 [Planctomycetota bacterium]|nr:hypothetical protein [Planctomycetota bacterium]
MHLEDGFARTAVDQTYFNHDHVQREGTFHFPLPADASIARLAMYVEGVLMEGGMVERDRARTVFETIRWQRRDPALLEWLDGSTFRMRVFPLEPRQEKRVVLGYTQRLPAAHGRVTYRFAAGHTLGTSGVWSFRARVKGGARLGWSCRTHALDAAVDGDDLVLTARHDEAALDRDLVLTLEPPAAPPDARVLLAEHDGWRYLALRLTNAAPLPPAWAPAAEAARRRDWVLVVETSADRDPVVARVAYDLARALLEAAEAGDTFALIAASTRPRLLTDGREPCTPARVQAALERLERQPLLGALDLGAAWSLAREVTGGATAPVLVHLGSAIPVIGERREAALLDLLPAGHVLGLGVGKRWNRALLRAAAARTGGYFTQVTPDEPVRWSALEARSALDAPRVVDLRVEAPSLAFLTDRDALAHGEEALAVARLARGDALPETLVVTGTLDGAPWRREVPLDRVERGAGYLPRAWARLEVDRLVALGPERRAEVVALSKQSHVLSPYTSLLVLETDAMHREFDVPKGRVEPWAPYALPARLEVRREAGPPAAPGGRRSVDEVLATTVLWRGDFYVEFADGSRDQGHVLRRGDLIEFSNGSRDQGLRINGPFPSQGLIRDVGPGGPLPAAPPGRVIGVTQQIPAQGSRRGEFAPDAIGNVIQTLEEGASVQAIFSRATRRMEDVDWMWRRDTMPEDADGNPTWKDDEDPPSLPGFERFLWPEDRGRIVVGNDFGVVDSELGRIDMRFGGFLHPQVRRSRGRTRSQDTRAPGVRYDRVLDTNGGDTRWTAFPSPRHPRALTADLLAFAPGMDTSQADVLAVLAAEASLPGPGRIDPAAAALVERARRATWTTVSLLDDEGRETGQIQVEGGGRFVAERRLRAGLIERIVSDGTTLWHLYPELGLGARRAWSGFHHDEVLRPLVPWLLPPPEHLARGADVVLAAAGQVEVLPHDAGRARQVLVFEGTSLVERRWTDADGRLLARERYAADGTVEVEHDRQRVTWRLPLRPRPALLRTELAPLPDLLLVPLPFRAPPASAWSDPERTDDDVLRLVGAGLCSSERWTAVQALARSPLARTPGGVTLFLQLGLGETWYVKDPASNLLLAAAEALAAESAVVRFALEHARWAHQKTVPPATLVGAAADSFLARLALYRHLHARWSSPTVSAVGVITRNETLDLLDRLATDPYGVVLAWDLAQFVTWNVNDDPAALGAFATVVERIAERPALAEPAGLLAVRLRAAAGDVEGYRERLLALHAQAIAQGRLLPLDDGVASAPSATASPPGPNRPVRALLARARGRPALDTATPAAPTGSTSWRWPSTPSERRAGRRGPRHPGGGAARGPRRDSERPRAVGAWLDPAPGVDRLWWAAGPGAGAAAARARLAGAGGRARAPGRWGRRPRGARTLDHRPPRALRLGPRRRAHARAAATPRPAPAPPAHARPLARRRRPGVRLSGGRQAPPRPRRPRPRAGVPPQRRGPASARGRRLGHGRPRVRGARPARRGRAGLGPRVRGRGDQRRVPVVPRRPLAAPRAPRRGSAAPRAPGRGPLAAPFPAPAGAGARGARPPRVRHPAAAELSASPRALASAASAMVERGRRGDAAPDGSGPARLLLRVLRVRRPVRRPGVARRMASPARARARRRRPGHRRVRRARPRRQVRRAARRGAEEQRGARLPRSGVRSGSDPRARPRAAAREDAPAGGARRAAGSGRRGLADAHPAAHGLRNDREVDRRRARRARPGGCAR